MCDRSHITSLQMAPFNRSHMTPVPIRLAFELPISCVLVATDRASY